MLRQIDQKRQSSLKVYECQYKEGDTLHSLFARSQQMIKDNYKKIMNAYYY